MKGDKHWGGGGRKVRVQEHFMADHDVLYEDGQQVYGICLIVRLPIINGHQKVKIVLKCTTLIPNVSFKDVHFIPGKLISPKLRVLVSSYAYHC